MSRADELKGFRVLVMVNPKEISLDHHIFKRDTFDNAVDDRGCENFMNETIVKMAERSICSRWTCRFLIHTYQKQKVVPPITSSRPPALNNVLDYNALGKLLTLLIQRGEHKTAEHDTLLQRA